MIPVVSAGSNQPGASETCTAHVSFPSGAAGAAVGASNPRTSTKARGNIQQRANEMQGRSHCGTIETAPTRRTDIAAAKTENWWGKVITVSLEQIFESR